MAPTPLLLVLVYSFVPPQLQIERMLVPLFVVQTEHQVFLKQNQQLVFLVLNRVHFPPVFIYCLANDCNTISS